MTTRGKPENAKSYDISLPSEPHKIMWKKVSTRDTMPSRYPHELPLTTLGIIEDFLALYDVSEGHHRRNRRNRRRGRPDPQEEFQAGTSAQLGDMFSYLQNMSNTWDNR